MSAGDAGDEGAGRADRRRPSGSVPPARRNNERRRRRAARASDRREERRRREMERRRAEREQGRAGAEGGQEPRTAPGAGPRPPRPQSDPGSVNAPGPRAGRPQPPDLPGMDRLRSSSPPPGTPPRDVPVAGGTPAEPRAAGQPGRSARPRPQSASRGAALPAGRRRTVVRRVDPWSVFRLSLVLYFCLLVVVTLGLVIFWLVLSRMGPMRAMLENIQQLGIPIEPSLVLQVLVPVGLLNVLVWSAANLFFCVLYNLVADLVGGLRVTLADEER